MTTIFGDFWKIGYFLKKSMLWIIFCITYVAVFWVKIVKCFSNFIGKKYFSNWLKIELITFVAVVQGPIFEKIGKKLAFMSQNKALLCKNFDHNIGFWENAIFCRENYKNS
jgi:hypothetical protein